MSLIDNKSVIFHGGVFQQTVGIPISTDCAPLYFHLFCWGHVLFMLFVIIYAYWYPVLLPSQIMFVPFNSNTAMPLVDQDLLILPAACTPSFLVGFVLLNLEFSV